QLLGRPMGRIIEPLERMGAGVASSGGLAPLCFGARGGPLVSIDYRLPVASAQVKSCILLAGLFADGVTTVLEPGPCRDHTERMLGAMGAGVAVDGRRISIAPPPGPLAPLDLVVPGDLSSAAFLIVAASIVPGSEILLEGVGVNPTRTGVIDALTRMGARIDVGRIRDRAGEPVADITVHSSELSGATFGGDEIVTMIDEIPVLALAATQASGTTVIRGASELRVKETDRIATTAGELSRLGASIEPREDGMEIQGPTPLVGTTVESHGDHRLAMTLAVAGLVARGRTTVREAHVAADSFPGFEECLASVGAGVEAS
ncbi:MAG: 3-phosphoshikimate 1-carboxyvinyltransferase, partial [Deltaproteobacteria bacterium]|nr:3-phosphoshikimate 1-carboxyvinyltransferase [Deltaproteobacteria bacterium]